MSQENDDSLTASFAKLPTLTKIAGVLLLVAKVNGCAGAAAMFAHRPLSAFLLSVAGVALVATLLVLGVKLGWSERPKVLEDRLAWHRAEIARIEATLHE